MRTYTAVLCGIGALAGFGFWQLDRMEEELVSDKPDASLQVDPAPAQEITCEGVNGTVCDLRANNLCGEGNWTPVAYPGDPFAMAHWIHDAGCYTGQSMLVRCKR